MARAYLPIPILITAAIPLFGCGGGGGGDSPGQPPGVAQNPACTADSTLNGDGTLRSRTAAYLCGTYGLTPTRTVAGGSQMVVDYFVSTPPNARTPKAMVVLIAGSGFNTRITGDVDGGPATGASGNFLVRSAQILANGDYRVVTLDRPDDAVAGPSQDENANVDRYRISVRHAIDILRVAERVNTQGLPLFVIGTSRGSMSAVATNPIANGVALSSPVTLGRTGVPDQHFLGDVRVPRLLATAMRRPALVLRNDLDECEITPPAGAVAFAEAMRAAGANVASESATGGFKVTAGASVADLAPCESLGFHSFMGIENLAVGRFIAWLDARVAAMAGNRPPRAMFTAVATAAGAPRQVALAALASDPDGDALSFELPYAETSLGGSVTLSGTVVTYAPPAGVSRMTDQFVFAVTDARGGVGAGLVSVEIGN